MISLCGISVLLLVAFYLITFNHFVYADLYISCVQCDFVEIYQKCINITLLPIQRMLKSMDGEVVLITLLSIVTVYFQNIGFA